MKIMKTENRNMKKSAAVSKMRGAALSLALAVGLASAGCSSSAHSSSAPGDPAETTVSETASSTVTASSAEAASAESAAAAAEEAVTGSTASETAEADLSRADAGATEETAEELTDEEDLPGEEDPLEEDAEDAGEDGTYAASVIEGVPDRDTADTALLESVLSKALVDCTGWGQSAGSSLRAASAATHILQWANQAQAGSADPEGLQSAVEAEYKRLSSNQRDMIRANWSQVSFNAETILDDIDELRNVLDDAGCLKAAQDAAADENAQSNWKAASDAIENMLR